MADPIPMRPQDFFTCLQIIGAAERLLDQLPLEQVAAVIDWADENTETAKVQLFNSQLSDEDVVDHINRAGRIIAAARHLYDVGHAERI